MRAKGFTLIELLVALAIMATILSIAVPRYFNNIETAQENVLREDLFVLRDSIDHFYSDRGVYPTGLKDLVDKNYLRKIPIDPFTQSANSWVITPPLNGDPSTVFDVNSGAPGMARDGTWLKDF